MVHFRQRRYWGPLPIMLIGGLLGVTVYAEWGRSPAQWLEFWPAHVLTLLIIGWYWLLVVRYTSREVVVDDEGLWIDGERQAKPADLVAVVRVGDPSTAMHLKRLDDDARGSGLLAYWFGRRAWLNRSWTRVMEVEGYGRVAVPRERDLARATGWDGVLVVSRRKVRGYRQGWLIGTYREARLLAALSAIAPDIEQVQRARDVPGRLV